MQCIAWAIKHFPVTHLEIVTLAYAAMNFMIYVFWWNKPPNVNWPVWVFQKSDVEELVSEPWRFDQNGLEAISTFITGDQDDYVNLNHKDKVPRFWANNTENNAGSLIW